MNLTICCDALEVLIRKLESGGIDRTLLKDLVGMKDDTHVYYIEEESSVKFVVMCSERRWDTDFFGINISDLHPFWIAWDMLAMESVSECVTAAMNSCFTGGASGIFCRLHSREIEMIRAFEMAGFRTYDIGCRFEATIDKLPKENQIQEFAVRELQDSEITQLVRLAGESFAHDRFHKDPRISSVKADAMHGEWVRNLSMDESVRVLVSHDQNELTGFMTIRSIAETNSPIKEYVIDLVAVDPSHRGKGHGRNLLGSLQRYVEADSHIFVGTQITNTQAMNLYTANGFVPESFYVTMHAWLDDF